MADTGTWKRRVRGAFGTGLAWAAAWFGAGLVLLAIVGPDAADVPFPLGFGFLGFLAGVAFSGVLGLVERGRSFERLSFARFTAWGAAGGVLLAAVFVPLTGLGGEALLGLGAVFGLAGAGSAAISLALAGRARIEQAPETGEGALPPRSPNVSRECHRDCRAEDQRKTE